MRVKCPVCGEPFEDSKLSAHLLEVHPEVAEPDETPGAPSPYLHICAFCGARLPTPEALKEHNATQHRM